MSMVPGIRSIEKMSRSNVPEKSFGNMSMNSLTIGMSYRLLSISIFNLVLLVLHPFRIIRVTIMMDTIKIP